MISHEYLLEILDYDPVSGFFTWRKQLAPRGKLGTRAGSTSEAGRGRVEIRIGGRLYLAHRLAWFYSFGVWPKNMIDHIDGNPSNNSLENLREATVNQNNYNRKKLPGSSSEWKGVSWDSQSKKWSCQLQKDGKHVHRSLHEDERDAAETYIFAALEHFGEFARAK